MGVLRYSLASVFRNRKRSIFAAIGIALALALVSGSFVAVDSSAYGLLRSAIAEVPVDFYGRSDNNDFYFSQIALDPDQLDEAVADLEAVKDVEKATPFVTVNGWSTDVFGPYWGQLSFAFLPSDSRRLLDSYNIRGNMPANGTVAISKSTSDSVGVGKGDQIVCSVYKNNGYYNYSNVTSPVWVDNYTFLNVSLTISEIWTQDTTRTDDYYYYLQDGYDNSSVYFEGVSNPVVLDLDSYTTVMNQTVESFVRSSGNWPRTTYLIWIDRDAVIDLADISGTISDLAFIQHRLMVVGQTYTFTVDQSPLEWQLTEMMPSLQYQKLLFFALSLPVVALGIYLSVVGVDLGITSRRREVGMLKSRGASNRQVLTGLLLEAVILGVIAGIVGLLLGMFVSRFLVGVAADIGSGTSADTYMTDFRIAGSTIELAIILAVVLMLLSSYRPFKRVSKIEVREALHQTSPTTASTQYKARTDIVLLILSGISIGSILLGFDWVSDQNWSWITRLIISVLMLVGIAIFPLMPFLLSLGVVRLVTMGSHKLYSKLTVIVKPWTRELHDLVNKNIVRNPKRASNLAVIISLALAFGLFISVTMESSIAYQKETIKFNVGSDVKLQFWGSSDEPMPSAESFAAIDGVASAVTYSQVNMRSTGGYGYYLSVALFDAEGYADVIHPSDFYFVDAGNGLLSELAQVPNSVIVSQSYAEYNYLLVGDTLRVQTDEWSANGTLLKSFSGSLKVIGMVKGLPGMGAHNAFVDSSSITWIPQANLTAMIGSGGVFIDAKSDANVGSIVSLSLSIARQQGWSATAQTMEGELARLESDVAYGTLTDFLYTEYGMAIVIMSVGVGLIIFVAVTDRQQEIACIMARGASSTQMRKILMGESMSLMALGLIVGAAVGTLTAYLFNTLTQPGFEGVVPHRMVFTYVTWIVVVVSVASLFIASFVATSRAGKMRLAEVLRIRGG